MSDKKYFSAVFEIKDASTFKKWFASVKGAEVTGSSIGDEMTRAEKLLEILDEENIYVEEDLR